MSPRRRNNVPDPEAQRELDAVDAVLGGQPVAPELTELEDLVRAVRAQRPTPRAEFNAGLDRRLAAGFGAPARRQAGDRRRRVGLGRLGGRLRSGRRGWMPALAGAASVLLALVVAVSALRGPQATGVGGSAVAPSSEVRQAPSTGAAGEGEAAAPSAVAPPSPPGQLPGRRDRRVERQAALILSADPERIDEVADGVIRVVDRHQGIVANSTVQSADDGRGGASFDLRIPVTRLGPALAELSQLAHVRSRTQSSQDVTGAHASAGERLRESSAERSSLLRQLARADTTNEAESIRARLRIVNGQIARTRTELARLGERTSYASVTLAIQPEGADQGTGGYGWTPRDALNDAVRILQFVASVLVVALALVLPLAVIGLTAAYGARVMRRRRREQALDPR